MGRGRARQKQTKVAREVKPQLPRRPTSGFSVSCPGNRLDGDGPSDGDSWNDERTTGGASTTELPPHVHDSVPIGVDLSRPG